MVESTLSTGVSINWLAQHFRMAQATVKKRLEKVQPIGHLGSRPVYSLQQVVGLLVPPSKGDLKDPIHVTSAKVIQTRGADTILLETGLPEPTWPFTGNACLKMSAAAGYGVEYVREHFGIEPELVAMELPT